MVNGKINTFIKEVEKRGYTATVEAELERIIVSKDDYYHVAIYLHSIFEAPFDYIMGYIEREIEELKKGNQNE